MLAKRLLHSNKSSLFISILFGVGVIAFLFACDTESCKYNYIGPKKNELDKIYRNKAECTKIKPVGVKCDSQKRQVNFA